MSVENISYVFIVISLMTIMFGVGLSLSWSDFRDIRKRKKAYTAGPNARQNILTWEQSNANAHRATLDPARHKRP